MKGLDRKNLSSSQVLLDKNSKLFLPEIFYYLVLVFLLLTLYAIPTNNLALARLSIFLTAVLNLVLFIFAIKKNSTNLSLILIMIIFISLFINMIVNKAFNYEIFVKIFSYLTMFIIVFYSENIRATKKTVDFISVIAIALSMLFIFLFFSPLAYQNSKSQESFRFYVDNSSSLSLGYSNSNEAAIFLMVLIIVLVLLIEIYDKLYLKGVFGCFAIFDVYLLYLTDSRSAFLAIIIFFVIYFTRIRVKISFILVSTILISIFLFALILPYAYQKGLLINEIYLNKSIYSGRERYFLELLNGARSSPIIGNIAKYKFDNAHNGMLAIFVSAGILNVILYIWFFARNITRRYNESNKYSYYVLVGILCVYFDSYGEAAMMVGGSIFAVLISILFVLSNIKVRIQIN